MKLLQKFDIPFWNTVYMYLFYSPILQVRPLNGSWRTIYQNTRNHLRFKPLRV